MFCILCRLSLGQMSLVFGNAKKKVTENGREHIEKKNQTNNKTMQNKYNETMSMS